jgi:vanillate O-demethylase ferredoxin subunit
MTALHVRVAGVQTEAEGVKVFTLESMAAEPLPAFAPGAHIEVRARISTCEEAWRAYSITSDPSQTHAYEIGVLRVGDHGVSAWLHDHVQVGDVLTIAPPRNDFLLADDAAEHVLLAGGIGLTPLLAMARWLERWGARYRLVVSAKTPGRLAFRDALSRLDTGPVRLHFTGKPPRLSSSKPAMPVAIWVKLWELQSPHQTPNRSRPVRGCAGAGSGGAPAYRTIK